jgi:hypothetical protein
VARGARAVGILVAEARLVALRLDHAHLDQSASSSSARIIGTPVRTPWPISARWQVMMTVPSPVMETKTSGFSTTPLGMP